MQKKSLFITATDTGVGKTLVSALLLRYAISKGIDMMYQKWVSTGENEVPDGDVGQCLKQAGLDSNKYGKRFEAIYRFGFPASPHLAAELEGRQIDQEWIARRWREVNEKHVLTIVEGVGGIMVPLRRDLLLVDLVSQLQIPAILVARSGLGTLNHTLLTVEALRHREIPILGVVFTDNEKDLDNKIVEDNIKTIRELGKVNVYGRIPWSDSIEKAYREFQGIADKILDACLSRDQ